MTFEEFTAQVQSAFDGATTHEVTDGMYTAFCGPVTVNWSGLWEVSAAGGSGHASELRDAVADAVSGLALRVGGAANALEVLRAADGERSAESVAASNCIKMAERFQQLAHGTADGVDVEVDAAALRTAARSMRAVAGLVQFQCADVRDDA